MILKQIKTIGYFRQLITIMAFFLPFFLTACGANGKEGVNASSSDTGSVNFSLGLQLSADAELPISAPDYDICEDYGIEKIQSKVTNSEGSIIAQGIWPCSEHAGSLQVIPKGNPLTLTIVGLIDGVETWREQVTDIEITGGVPTELGVIRLGYIGDDTEPPQVLKSHVPAAGASDVIVIDPEILVPFSEPVVKAKIDTSTCRLTETATSAIVNCTVTYDPDAMTATMRPELPLKSNTQYTVTIAKTIRDRAGIEMAGDHHWNFTTQRQTTGTINFKLTNQSPGEDFCEDYGIDVLTARVVDASGTVIAGEQWTSCTDIATIAQIPQGSGLTVVFTGMVDSIEIWRYQVQDVSVTGEQTTDIGDVQLDYNGDDTEPPYVLDSHMPPSFATGVIGTPVITVPFSEDVIAASVNPSTCILTVLDTSGVVNSAVRYDATTHLGTISPNETLDPDTTYTVTITTGIQDKAGIAMVGDYSWNFTTKYVCRQPTLESIGNRRVMENEPLKFTVNATAPAGSRQVYSADLPVTTGNAMTFQNRTFDWTPGIGDAGEYTVTFRVCDEVCEDDPDMCDAEDIVITVDPLTGAYEPDIVGPDNTEFNCNLMIGTVSYTVFNAAGEVIFEEIRDCSSYLEPISGIPVGDNIRLVAAATDANGSVIRRGEDRNIAIEADQTTLGDPVIMFSVRVIESTGMVFHLIMPDGPFMMGSPEEEAGRYLYEQLHEITISTPFYMQNTEVTQGQWKAIMPDNPSRFQACGDNCPVESITWEETQAFIDRLNALGEGTFRLPTEAEWEYAARAGADSEFAFCATALADLDITSYTSMDVCALDPNLDMVGWFCANSAVTYSGCENRELYGGSACDGPHPVGMKEPNVFGLFDMHGNVNEWCQDWYDLYYYYDSEGAVDPIGPSAGSMRVARGGSWDVSARNCRSACRKQASPTGRSYSFGLRLVLEQ